VNKDVPPAATLYQFNAPPVPVAVMFKGAPNAPENVEALKDGAAGDAFTVTVCEPLTVNPFLVTLATPEVPFPANPVMEVLLTTVKAVTAVPPMDTAVTPERLVPVMVKVPELAHNVNGVMSVMVGANEDQA